MEKKHNGLIVVIIIVIILAVLAPAILESSKEDDMYEFRNQLQKDPSTWTSKERSRFNSFAEWEEKQD